MFVIIPKSTYRCSAVSASLTCAALFLDLVSLALLRRSFSFCLRIVLSLLLAALLPSPSNTLILCCRPLALSIFFVVPTVTASACCTSQAPCQALRTVHVLSSATPSAIGRARSLIAFLKRYGQIYIHCIYIYIYASSHFPPPLTARSVASLPARQLYLSEEL